MDSIDECSVRGCGAWVRGTSSDNMFEGADYVCDNGHILVVCVKDGKAKLVWGGARDKVRARKSK